MANYRIADPLVRPPCRGGWSMDGQQFDRWTRLFTGMSRREATKLLVSLAAGPLALAGIRSSIAQVTPEGCGKDGDHCHGSGDCCNKFKCKNGHCRKKNQNNNNCG